MFGSEEVTQLELYDFLLSPSDLQASHFSEYGGERRRKRDRQFFGRNLNSQQRHKNVHALKLLGNTPTDTSPLVLKNLVNIC